MKILINNNSCLKSAQRFYSRSILKLPWDVLFFGTDKFSLASLQVLDAEKCENGKIIRRLDVVTSPRNNCINNYAKKQSLNVFHWPLPKPHSLPHYDIGLVVSFGHLIPKHVIDAFPMGMINVHASLLPRWQGAAPIIHALAAGDKQTGVTIMKIRPHKFDIGEIIHQEIIGISDHILMPELHSTLAELGAKNLLYVLEKSPEILAKATPQDQTLITLAPKIHSTNANVNFETQSAKDLYNLHRALYGLHSLVVSYNRKRVKIHNIIKYIETKHDVNIGRVSYDNQSKLLKIAVKDGWIYVNNIGVQGKRVMSAIEFQNGYLKKSDIIFQNGNEIIT